MSVGFHSMSSRADAGVLGEAEKAGTAEDGIGMAAANGGSRKSTRKGARKKARRK
jgi:hypothetical protein